MDLILYNPLSKNSKSNIQTHKLVQEYKKSNIPFRLKSILKIDDIRLYLEDKSHIDNVILLGGDGTINRFVNNIIDYDLKQDIYLKSNGSGNDFLRSLKTNDDLPQHIMKVVYDSGKTTHFVNGVGIGLDGLVAQIVDSQEKKGKLRYMWCTIKGMFKFIPEPATVIADGKEYKYDKVYIVAVNNGKYFGGGMQITPDANISDENLDVIIVHTISKLFILPIFFTIYVGLHTKFTKYVTNFKAKHVEAIFTTPQISETDGESHYDVTSMKVESSQKLLHLRCYDNKKSA